MRTNNNEKLIMSSLYVLSATVLCAGVNCEGQIQCKTNSFEVIRCSFDIVARFLHQFYRFFIVLIRIIYAQEFCTQDNAQTKCLYTIPRVNNHPQMQHLSRSNIVYTFIRIYFCPSVIIMKYYTEVSRVPNFHTVMRSTNKTIGFRLPFFKTKIVQYHYNTVLESIDEQKL